jgi:methionyl-tRNA formyltransferase
MEILFLGKKNDYHVDKALSFLKQEATVEDYLGDWKDPLPEGALWWEGDYIISYCSRWIVPQALISRAKEAINFHPGPPEYPGIGCVNFALYDNAWLFGVTAHRIAHPVDSGAIIAASRFQVFPSDTVESLLDRTDTFLLALFYRVMAPLLNGQPAIYSHEKWARKAYTRRELNQLAEVTADMNEQEIHKRARAVTYRDYGLTLKGYRVEL